MTILDRPDAPGASDDPLDERTDDTFGGPAEAPVEEPTGGPPAPYLAPLWNRRALPNFGDLVRVAIPWTGEPWRTEPGRVVQRRGGVRRIGSDGKPRRPAVVAFKVSGYASWYPWFLLVPWTEPDEEDDMKITPAPARGADPRTEPLPLAIDEAGLARWVQDAHSAEEAWGYLGLPGGRAGVDPTAVSALAAAATALCATGDSIGQGVQAFGERDPSLPIPASWIDRMVELYVALLAGHWALDDLAYAGLVTGGWTITTPQPPADDPASRIAQRARWVAEESAPKEPALWFDKRDHALGRAVTDAQGDPDGLESVREAGRALVEEATRRRFAGWATRRDA